MSEEGIDRRTFLKGAAAGAAVATTIAQTTAQAQGAAAATTATPVNAAKEGAALPSDTIIARPGSDFMLDVIRATGLEYIASNPAASFRSLHESIVNYGGNRKPEFLTCMHEESSVAMAHGYFKASGKMMGVLCHASVGLQHASMALYNAWCDRVPLMLFAGNGLAADKRRPGVEWYHSVQDPMAMVRDYVKWDDQPVTLQHFAESTVRAYKMALTPPYEPVGVVVDMDLQEEAVHDEAKLKIPKVIASIPPQGDVGALREAVKMLIAAERPVIIADRATRSQAGVDGLVQFAEALGAPVVDLGGRMNFPGRHPLNLSEQRGNLVANADVILLLEVADPFGVLNRFTDPYKEQRPLYRPGTKIVHVSLAETIMKSNYQDQQRFMPVDLTIQGDVEASLPTMLEALKAGTTTDRVNAFRARAEAMAKRSTQMHAATREAAAVGWDASPITTARLSAEVWNTVKNENWSLVVSDRVTWPKRMWPATKHHQMLGGSGGFGIGYSAPAAVGAALANRDRGILSVTIQPDGDLCFAPGVLWTAAHHKIPLLMVMFNNRAYHQEVMHLQRMAAIHNRSMSTAHIGTTIDTPHMDFAKLAQAHGVWGEGPISDPNQLGPALQRALKVVKSGAPAVVDAVCQGR